MAERNSPGTRQVWGPERLGGQGLDAEQQESGNRAIELLLTDPAASSGVDLVITWRQDEEGGAYEVWSQRGLLRFRRLLGGDGTLEFEVLEVVGENPVANQSDAALRTLAQESAAAERSGFEAENPKRRYIAPAEQSYPFAYERIAQLFDSPNAPDLVISPTDWAQGPYAGNHGGLHVRQARGPLWFKGPRVRAGEYALAARSVDIAPTALAALEFPLIDGANASGRSSSERGVAPDVRLGRQDGRVLDELLDTSGPPARRLYLFTLDGLHMTELDERLAGDPAALPNLRRLREGAAVVANGSIVNFPSITWPSHTSIGTGAWCGHHDVVNPSYYLRDKRESVSPQGQQIRTEGFSSSGVESLYEAFHRVRGREGWSAAIHAPFGRGADHATLEGRNLGDRGRLKALTSEIEGDCDERWDGDGFEQVINESMLDNRGMAQVIELFTKPDRSPPDFVYHELIITDGAGHDYGPHDPGLRAALDESDRRIGRVLDLLEQRGVLDETLIVLTSDHGMAPQDPEARENPVRQVEVSEIEAVVAEPMIWLLDLAVRVERMADGRTGRVFAFENDALPSGEQPAVEGAEVTVELRVDANHEPRVLARGRSGPGGVYGFATPPEAENVQILVRVHKPGFNPRRVRLDGASEAIDLRARLYAASGSS
jgi:hypothetical protein